MDWSKRAQIGLNHGSRLWRGKLANIWSGIWPKRDQWYSQFSILFFSLPNAWHQWYAPLMSHAWCVPTWLWNVNDDSLLPDSHCFVPVDAYDDMIRYETCHSWVQQYFVLKKINIHFMHFIFIKNMKIQWLIHIYINSEISENIHFSVINQLSNIGSNKNNWKSWGWQIILCPRPFKKRAPPPPQRRPFKWEECEIDAERQVDIRLQLLGLSRRNTFQ